MTSRRSAARAAYLAAAFNLAAGLVLLFLLRPGLPAVGSDLTQRLFYVQAHLTIWWTGWIVWHAAAISLLAFYIALARLWFDQAPIRTGLAIVCAGAGLAADLSAEGLYMGALPYVDPAQAALAETISEILTGYVGNGLYSIAGISLVTAGIGQLPRPLVALSAPVWLAGLSLSAATVAHSTAGQFWATAALMPLFVIWTGLVGRWLDRTAS